MKARRALFRAGIGRVVEGDGVDFEGAVVDIERVVEMEGGMKLEGAD